MPSRRTFLLSAASAALPMLTSVSADPPSAANPVCVFTKPFNSLTFDELAAEVARIGFAGIEAPIRRGGHIEPDQVADRLPDLVAALRRRNCEVSILTSDINRADAPDTERTLSTAAALRIPFYRMKYFKYDESRPVRQQIIEWKAALRDLAAMNRELGITAVYQNHAGRNYFGAPIWDLHLALEDIDPSEIGVAYDIRHATVEAGTSWPIAFRLIRPHIKVVYVKDFVWGESRPTNVPLGQGRVQDAFFRMLKSSGFSGPISLHEEYLDHRKPELVPEHWRAIERDYETLKRQLKTA